MLKYIDKNGKSKPLTKYSDLCIEEVLDYGDKTLTCNISYDEDVALEDYIRTKTDEYTIKQKNSGDGIYVITAKLNIDELEGTPFQSFETTEKTALETANLAIAGTGWSCECSIEKKRTVKLTNVSSWEILKKIADTFILEMQIDSIKKKIIYKEKVGTNKGTYFSDQLNLISLESQSNTNDFYTSIFPLGKDGLTIESVNDGNRLLEDYTYSNKKKTFIWKDDRYTDPQSLKEDAKAKLSDMSKPYTAYSCSIIDLSRHSKKYKNYNIGDEITLIDRASKTKIKQRIKKKVAYPDKPEKDTCEVSNLKLTFTEYAQKYNAAAATVSNITTDNGTVDGNTVDSIDAGKVKNLDDVIAKNGEFQKISVRIINVSDELVAAESRIGILETTKISSAEADLKYASIARVEGVEGKFNNFYAGEFESAVSKINDLTVGVEKVNTLMFGSASGSSLTTEFSNSVVSLIGDAQIKDAMIANISASKITSGAIYTNLVKIYGDNSKKLCIEDNTIQMSDDNGIVRMQMGEDSQGRYNIIIRNSYEDVIFDASGVTEKGYHDGSIKNIAVADDANISAKKLDITSLFSEINGSSETIKSSRIYVDADGQTLDVSFKTMQTNVSALSTDVNTQGTQISLIQGQISSKIWQSDITTAVNNVQIGGRNLYYLYDIDIRQLHCVDSYSVNDGEITLVANGNDLYIGEALHAGDKWRPICGALMDIEGASYVTINISNSLFNKNYYNFLDADKKALSIYTYWNISSGRITVPSGAKYLNLRVGYGAAVSGTTYKLRIKVEKGNKATDWSPAPEDVESSITTLSDKYTDVKQTVDGLSTTVASHTTQIANKADSSTVTSVSNKVTSLEQNLTGFKTTVSDTYATKTALNAVDGKFANYSTTTQMNSAIQQKANEINLTVSANYTTKSEFNNLQVGGRNLLKFTDKLPITGDLNTGIKCYLANYAGFVNTNDGAKLTFNSNANTSIQVPFANELNISSGQKVTLSFDYRGNITSFGMLFLVRNSGGNIGLSNFPALVVSETEWQHYEYTFSHSNSNSGTCTSILMFYNLGSYGSDKWIEIKKGSLELEKGTKATDWSPAPEDVNDDILALTTQYSTLEQTLSGFKVEVGTTYATKESLAATNAALELKVSKTDTGQIISMINASADAINITAANGGVNISGGKFTLSSPYTTISADGSINCSNLISTNAKITGGSIKIKTDNISEQLINIRSVNTELWLTPNEISIINNDTNSSFLAQPDFLSLAVNGLICFRSGSDGTFVQNLTIGISKISGYSGLALSNGYGYELVLQGDGNLVLYHNGVAIWDTGTSGM